MLEEELEIYVAKQFERTHDILQNINEELIELKRRIRILEESSHKTARREKNDN